jgi:hypothetical protein
MTKGKKIFFLSIFTLIQNYTTSSDVPELSDLTILNDQLIEVNPWLSFMRAIILGAVAAKITGSEEQKKNDENSSDISITHKLKSKITSLIGKKIIERVSLDYMNDLYTDFFYPSIGASINGIYDKDAVKVFVKNNPTSSLSKSLNEISAFLSLEKLVSGFGKASKSFTRMVKRACQVTYQSMLATIAAVGLYVYITEEHVKPLTNTLIQKSPLLKEQKLSRDAATVIIPICLDTLIVSPLIEHYCIPGFQSVANYFTPELPLKSKIDTMFSIARITKENFYNYEEKEEHKDYKDMYGLWKYSTTGWKFLQTFKYLPILKYLPFIK